MCSWPCRGPIRRCKQSCTLCRGDEQLKGKSDRDRLNLCKSLVRLDTLPCRMVAVRYVPCAPCWDGLSAQPAGPLHSHPPRCCPPCLPARMRLLQLPVLLHKGVEGGRRGQQEQGIREVPGGQRWAGGPPMHRGLLPWLPSNAWARCPAGGLLPWLPSHPWARCLAANCARPSVPLPLLPC